MPPLLLLDINGLFVKRIHELVYNQMNHKYRYDFKTKNRYCVFVRPYTKEFFEYVFDHFEVGFWSSMKINNTMSIIDNFVTHGYMTKAQHEKIKLVLNQEDCTDLGEKTSDDIPIFYKDLHMFLKTHKGKPYKFKTVLVDDSEHKTKFNPPNTSIHVSKFDAFECEDKELYMLILYLQECIKNDMYDFISKCPFNTYEINYNTLETIQEEKKEDSVHDSASPPKRKENNIFNVIFQSLKALLRFNNGLGKS